MADDAQSKASELAALQESIDKTSQASRDLFNQASQATGNTQRSLLKLAQVFDSISKNEAQLLKTTEKINKAIDERAKLQEDIAKAEDKRKPLLKKQIEEQDEVLKQQIKQHELQEAQIKSQKEFVSQIGKTKGILGELVSNQVAQMGAYIASTASLTKGIQGLFNATQRVANISIAEGSYFGMSGNFLKDFKALSGAAVVYSAEATRASAAAVGLGHSQEEANQAFQRFSRIAKAGSMGERAEEMRKLTTVAAQLSTVLGTSLGETTEFMIQSQTKFGRTGAQTADTLASIQKVTEKTNREFGHTVIQGRDVTKVLFDIAGESNSLAQDQKFLASTITNNLVQLQAQGFTYDTALKATGDYVKKLTTQAPDWAKILAGKNLVNTLGSTFDQISPQMIASLEKAKPGISKKLKDVYNSGMDNFSKSQVIQQMLQDTQVGFNAMQDEMLKVINVNSEGALQRIMAVYNISNPLEAQAILMQAKSREEELKFKNITAAKAKELYGISEAEFEVAKKKGNEGQVTALVQDRIAKQAKTEQDQTDATAKNARAARLMDLKKQSDELTAQLRLQGRSEDEIKKSPLIKSFQEEIGALSAPDMPLTKTMDDLGQKLAGFKAATGGIIKEAVSFLTSDIGKVLGAVFTLYLMRSSGKQQLKVLEQIRDILGGGGGSGGSRGGDAVGSAKSLYDAFKKGGLKRVGRTASVGLRRGLGPALRGGLKSAGGLAKGAGKFLKGKGGLAALASLGIDLFENKDAIGKGFSEGGLGGGAKELFKSTLGQMNIGSLLGGGVGSLLGPVGSIVGAEAGEAIANAFGAGNINSMLGLDKAQPADMSNPAAASSGLPGAISGAGPSGGGETIMKKINIQKTTQGPKFGFEVDLGEAMAWGNKLYGRSGFE